MEEAKKQIHIVLIHGAGHGAWCWYKVVAQLRSRNHRVTALDMAASGVDIQPLSEVRTFADYSRPLMEFLEALPPEESVVLVGHSMGGVCLSLAMEKFPKKIQVAVFVAASMEGPKLSSQKIDEQLKIAANSLMDCKFTYGNGDDKPPTCFFFGPEYLATKLYKLSPLEDLILATSLVRPVALIKSTTEFSEENYGSVRRVSVLPEKDHSRELQEWVIQNNPPDEVKTIYGADHMCMLSKPQEFCVCLDEIVDKYC